MAQSGLNTHTQVTTHMHISPTRPTLVHAPTSRSSHAIEMDPLGAVRSDSREGGNKRAPRAEAMLSWNDQRSLNVYATHQSPIVAQADIRALFFEMKSFPPMVVEDFDTEEYVA